MSEPAPTVEPVDAEPPKSLWHNGDFVKFWFGETVSLYGAQITTLALPLTALYTFNATPEEVGLLRFLWLVPYLLFALLFGAFIDRVRRRPVMLGANLARLVLIGLVPVLAWSGVLSIGPLFAIAFLAGTASVLFDLSWMSLVPALVRDRRLMVEANSKLGVSASSADAAGPGLAGVLVNALTAPVAMAVNAVTYLVSLVSLLLIRTPEPEVERPPSRNLRAELAEGLKWVFGNRYMRAIALVGSSCNFFTIGVSTMFVVYAVRDRGISAALLGLILSVAAAGGILGAAITKPMLRWLPLGTGYQLSVGVIFLGPLLIPLAPESIPVAAVMFVCAFLLGYVGLGTANVLIMSLRQNLTPNRLMGRMNAGMRTTMFGGGALGGPVAGALAGWLGLHTALWILAIASAAMLIPIAASPVGKLKEMPTRPDEP
jgi:MFS family permease